MSLPVDSQRLRIWNQLFCISFTFLCAFMLEKAEKFLPGLHNSFLSDLLHFRCFSKYSLETTSISFTFLKLPSYVGFISKSYFWKEGRRRIAHKTIFTKWNHFNLSSFQVMAQQSYPYTLSRHIPLSVPNIGYKRRTTEVFPFPSNMGYV